MDETAHSSDMCLFLHTDTNTEVFSGSVVDAFRIGRAIGFAISGGDFGAELENGLK